MSYMTSIPPAGCGLAHRPRTRARGWGVDETGRGPGDGSPGVRGHSVDSPQIVNNWRGLRSALEVLVMRPRIGSPRVLWGKASERRNSTGQRPNFAYGIFLGPLYGRSRAGFVSRPWGCV